MDSDRNSFATTDKLVNYLDPRYRQHAVEEEGLLIIIVQCIQNEGMCGTMLMNYALCTGSSLTNCDRVFHDEFEKYIQGILLGACM